MVRTLSSGLILAVLATIVTACSSSHLDVGSHPDGVTANASSSAKGRVFGSELTLRSTFADDGSVLELIVRLPMSAVEGAQRSPDPGPVLSLQMPSRVSSATFFEHLDLYWKSDGDGPTYDNAHFDFHFFRMTPGEVAAIDCLDPSPVPLELLPAGYSKLGIQTCLLQSGVHVSPDSDFIGVPFTKTMILGFYGGRTTLVEPMLTSDALRARRSFRVPLPTPPSLGGARTRFPTTFDARFDAAGDAYDLVFGAFVTID